MSTVFNDQDNEFDNIRFTTFDGVTVNRNPTTDNEVSKKTYVDGSLGEGTIPRFNKAL